jgi:hypothetical protein
VTNEEKLDLILQKLDAQQKQLDIITEIVTRHRNLSEQALEPLIDGYLEIKQTEARKYISNPSKQ